MNFSFRRFVESNPRKVLRWLGLDPDLASTTTKTASNSHCGDNSTDNERCVDGDVLDNSRNVGRNRHSQGSTDWWLGEECTISERPPPYRHSWAHDVAVNSVSGAVGSSTSGIHTNVPRRTPSSPSLNYHTYS